MNQTALMTEAAAVTVDLARGVKPDQFDATTPCSEYNVRALANHLSWVALISAHAARKLPHPTDGSHDRDADHTDGDWATRFAKQVDDLLAAWAGSGAWQGVTTLGSPREFPAEMAGAITLCDLVLHGWDLARATGQPFHCSVDVAEATYQVVAGMAEQGRTMGAFGAEVPVPASAPALDRALGISGRDPQWPE